MIDIALITALCLLFVIYLKLKLKAQKQLLLSEGMSMRSICREESMPCMQTIWRWLREKEEFSERDIIFAVIKSLLDRGYYNNIEDAVRSSRFSQAMQDIAMRKATLNFSQTGKTLITKDYNANRLQ